MFSLDIDAPASSLPKQDHNSKTETRANVEIELGLPYMVPDLVY